MIFEVLFKIVSIFAITYGIGDLIEDYVSRKEETIKL